MSAATTRPIAKRPSQRLLEALADLAKAFQRIEAPSMVIGGIAVIAHTVARQTVAIVRGSQSAPLDREDRLELFDRATARQRKREAERGPIAPAKDRGWKREDLYDRGSPR